MIKMILMVIAGLTISSCASRYHTTPEYKCKRTCIDANMDYQKVKYPGCLCKYKDSQK